MDISQINWLAVIVGTFAMFVIGAIWFGPKTFYPVWHKALGKSMPSRDESNQKGAGTSAGIVFGMTFVAALVQATTLALIIQIARELNPDFTWICGAGLGLLLGFGIGAASSLSHRLFSMQGWKVWLIEVGQDVLSLTAAGAIIGAWV